MSRVHKFSLFVILSLILSFTISTGYAATYHYATTDMTFAEFYAGETKESSSDLHSQGLDAISTPTTHGLARFPLVLGVSGDTGTTISGLKAVQVRMTEDVYSAMSSDSRFTFTASSFDEYKPVNSNGTFGAMVTETAAASDAVASIASGSSARWGHYVISVKSADITIGSANRYCDYYLGALLETSDGKIYGLRHDNNIWSNTDIAFCVSENYTEPHGTGVTRDYDYTVNLEGQTITKLTYMLKGRPDVVINTNLYVKRQTEASVSAVSPDLKSGASVQVKFTLTSADSYSFSGVALRSGRTSTPVTDCTYSDGVLTLNNPVAGTYTATFTSDEYVDISANFTVSDYYAVTDMTWAEFYAGEVAAKSSGELFAAGMDAVSSPTARVASRFTQLVSVSNDIGGRDITGVKDVQVRMTGDVYNALTDKSRYTFTDDVFAEYKPVSLDGSFGAMVTETVTASSADVTLSSGASAVWGNYVLKISSADVTLGSGDTRYYLGALMTTSDGKIYGMRHNNNLWFSASDMALAVREFVEVHGVSRRYVYTSDMTGKTITKIQYMLKNLPDVVVNCNVTLPQFSTATVSLANDAVIPSGKNAAIPLTFSGLPDGVTYDLVSLYSGSGRNRTYITDYTYSDNTLTINGDLAAGNYTAVFHAEGYTDIALTFRVEGYHYATTNMTWAEFYAGEIGAASADLWNAGLDAVSSSTKRIAGRFTQLVSADNDLGGADIVGVRSVQVRMTEDVYQILSRDSRYTFVDSEFAEYKEVASDGSFGEMLTEYEEADAAVTLKSGANSTWGNYMLSIEGANVAVTSGDERLDLGALITTSDGKVYGLRHNSNLWFSAGEMALTYKDFIEPHGIARDYDYTSDLQGKTVTKIQFMLKNQPDVVISCNVFLKLESPASVSYAYPDGYNGILAGTGDPIAITFSDLPDGTAYDIASVTPSIRHAAALDSELYEYSDGELSFAPTVGAGRYKAVFSTERYSDLAATVEVFTTDATSLIVSDDNNGAALNFLLTPKGYIDAVDEVLNANKFANASDYTHIPSNTTAEYTAGTNEVSGSGFTFDIVLDGVSSDYTGIVGFGKQFTMTSETLGSAYNEVYTTVNSVPVGASGFREIPQFSALNSAGLKVVQVFPDGTSRDISGLTGTGAMINSDGSIFLFYGVMAADSSNIAEGEYTLSPEGEILINDGAKDGHIRVTIYIECTESGSSTPDTPATPDTPDEGDSYSATPSTPALNVQDSAAAQKIIDALSSSYSAVTSSTAVTSLSENSAGRKRGINSVSTEELDAIPDNETIALILPLMSVDQEAVYVFGVDLSSLEAGAYIFLHMTAESKTADAAAFYASAQETAYTFLDDDGSETKVVPENKHVNIAAYMQPGYTYAPIITTSSPSYSTLGSAGGGCDVMSTIAPMMLAVLLLAARKK